MPTRMIFPTHGPFLSGNKKNGESFWVKLKLKTIILSRNVVNINNKISHDKCNSRQCLPTTPWNCPRFKQEKNCDSELFCTNSLSLHLGRIKMSLSKLKFKGRVIWTEKCGLTFTFYIGYHNFLHGSTKTWNPEYGNGNGIRNLWKKVPSDRIEKSNILHILATSGRPAMKCWEWQ